MHFLTLITALLGFAVTFPEVSAAEIGEPETPCRAERWTEAIQKLEAEDAAQPPVPGGVLFVGSSSIRLWDLEKYFPGLPVVNRGFGGSEICDSVYYFDTLVAKHQPKTVVFYAGDNDVAGGKKAAQVLRDFRAFDAKLEEELPSTRLIYISIKPSIARWELAAEMRRANCLICSQCRADPNRLTYLDIWCPMLDEQCQPRKELFAGDGLHLNDEGYQLWSGLVKRQLDRN